MWSWNENIVDGQGDSELFQLIHSKIKKSIF